MNYFIYILKIVFPIMYIFTVYYYIKRKKNNKFSKLSIVIFCTIMGLYSVISGNLSDRLNYGNFFSKESYAYIVERESLGLYLVYKFLHLFTYDRYVLFFFITFIYYFLTFITYNNWNEDEKTPLALLLLGISTYSVWGLYAFKQCIAVALIMLGWSFYSKRNIKIFIALLIFAVIFHESALIIIPLFLCLNIVKKSSFMRNFLYLILFLSIIFYNQICTVIYGVVNLIPGMDMQLSSYVNESGVMIGKSRIITIAKGMPFYIISLYALKYRKKFVSEINNYDKYLTLSIFGSVTYLMSSYMYWMWRFGLYCYLPMFILFSKILMKIKNKESNLVGLIVINIMLFIIVRYLIQCYFIYGGIY